MNEFDGGEQDTRQGYPIRTNLSRDDKAKLDLT